jgi:transcriptional regulator with XRE-family HTH domain
MVREARGRRRWTQERLAQEAGCSLGYVRNVEQGVSRNPSLFPMLRVAMVLELPIEDLADTPRARRREGEPRKYNKKATIALPERPDESLEGKWLVIAGPVTHVRPPFQVDIHPVTVTEED